MTPPLCTRRRQQAKRVITNGKHDKYIQCEGKWTLSNWEITTRIILKDMQWIRGTLDGALRQTVVNTALNFRITPKARNVFGSWDTVGFTGRTLPRAGCPAAKPNNVVWLITYGTAKTSNHSCFPFIRTWRLSPQEWERQRTDSTRLQHRHSPSTRNCLYLNQNPPDFILKINVNTSFGEGKCHCTTEGCYLPNTHRYAATLQTVTWYVSNRRRQFKV
jgi:hypothetical protein